MQPICGCFIGDRPEDADGRRDLLGRVLRLGCRVLHRHPELGVDLVPFEQVEDDLGRPGRARPGNQNPGELDAVPLERVHLGVEARDVLARQS